VTDDLGKKAEAKIKAWLNRPQDGYCFERIPDQLTGFYGSKNICDFFCFKKPYLYFIESKATYKRRFDFTMVTDYQWDSLLSRSKIDGVYGVVIVLFASSQRAFILNIQDLENARQNNIKSLNIDKIDRWQVPYKEIRTVPSKKLLLDYTGEIEDYFD
jgi:penicillin-binding protein-related factor A (putative recombinase)